ncbi:DUF1173 family protein [Mesorhizobium silamurunense]|uniref:DUF1173 family protein n=1 Tax=Mesorhizobium silamurunense TaxID=499528 RepID=UPI00177DB01A
MRQFRIGDPDMGGRRRSFNRCLRRGYERRQRPLCLCREQPVVVMYIARLDGQYLVKRMP